MMNYNIFIIPFILSLCAGLSTGIGSTIALFAKKTNTKFLSVALGFSAGVMLYVSFVELLYDARNTLTGQLGENNGLWITAAAFFTGIFFIGIIDKLVPSFENPHEARAVEEMDRKEKFIHKKRLLRVGFFTALVIAIHNFPEGIAVFITSISDVYLGLAIFVAVAIHNIPEGIAVSVPIYHATGSRKKAFWYSFLSGLAEPLGALIAYFIIIPFFGLSNFVLGIIFAATAGIMVFLSLDELLPAAREYGEHHLSIYGLIAGMAVMAVSLLIIN